MSGRPGTTRHYEILKVLRKQIVPGKFCPTLKQLSEMTGINRVTVNFYIQRLISEGLISRDKYSRSLQLTGTAEFMPISGTQVKRKAKNIERKFRRAAQKMTPQEEHDCFENAVKLGKKNDLTASRENAAYDRLNLFDRGGVRGTKL